MIFDDPRPPPNLPAGGGIRRIDVRVYQSRELLKMTQKNVIRLLVCLIMARILFFNTTDARAFVYEERIVTSKSLAHYAMGQVCDLLGLTEDAASEYEQALEFDASSYLIHLRLGATYTRLGLFAEAIEELNVVKKYNPEELQTHYLLALIYSAQKEYEMAAGEYEFILKSVSKNEPQNIEVYGYLGQLYYSQKKYDQAIEQFEKMLELEPKNADVMYLLGSLYIEVGKRDLAVSTLKKSIEIDAQHDGSLNTLGYIYAENNENLDQAEELIKRALAISPDNGAYLDSLGWVYYQKGMYAQALEVCQKADQMLKDPVIYDHLGDVYYKLNRVKEAIDQWELSIELKPDQEKITKKINAAKASIQVTNSN